MVKELCVITGTDKTSRPIEPVFVAGRLPGLQAFEALVREATGTSRDLRGSFAFKQFLEAGARQVTWYSYRIDVVDNKLMGGK